MLSFDDCKIGSYIGGDMFCGRYASGTIVSVFPGLGFIVENDSYEYFIVNKFSDRKMRSNFLNFGSSEYNHISLTDETILFWLKGGCKTKAKIYGIEVTRCWLINPMSDAGLRLRTMVSPLLLPHHANEINSEIWKFIKETGEFPESSGDAAPLPHEVIYKNTLEKQENQWHLARARILTDDEAKPYKYTFLQCGKKLLIELDGKKKATVNYKGSEVHLYTPAHSVACSPAQPFMLASPPLPLEDPLWGGENKFVEVVKRLTEEEIDEGIEEAYWEMKRIRIKGSGLDADFMNIQKWMDAAYDEKQARREEYNSNADQYDNEFSAYTGIV